MIKNLIYKELKLSVQPWMYVFLAAAFMLLFPAWVFVVPMAFIFLVFMFIIRSDKANQDLAFVPILPIPKKDAVTARTATLVIVELAALVVAIPVAVARFFIYHEDNTAGMNVNLAFFGFLLLMYTVFNAVYLYGAYQRPYRMLWPILGGSILAVFTGVMLTSAVVYVPTRAMLFNDRGLGNIGGQLIVFFFGAILYAVTTYAAYRKAVTDIAKLDL